MSKVSGFQPRLYQNWIKDTDLVSFNVAVKETELYVRAEKNLSQKCLKTITKYRKMVEKYIETHPEFRTSLEPLKADKSSPLIIQDMAHCAKNANVGPMASIAGAISEYVGSELLQYTSEIIVENGGDIFLKVSKPRTIGIYAGEKSAFSQHLSNTGKKTIRIGLKIKPEETPLGICTSSGTVGHSLSFGNADAVVVVSKSAILADAAATAIGNIIQQESDIPAGIELAGKIKGIKGVILIKNDKMGLWGSIEICRL